MSHFDQISDLSPKSVFHRGGRIVKWKERAASMVSHVAELRLSVSAAAVGAALMFGTGIGGTAPAMAGSCTESPAGSGDFVCSGPAGPFGDIPQVLTSGGPVTVTTEPDFGMFVFGDALVIDGVNGTSFDDAEVSTIAGTQSGIIITNTGTDSLSFTSNGTIGGTFGDGIDATNAVGTSDLTITSNVVNGGENGIVARNFGTGALTINSTGAASGTDINGIEAYNSDSGGNLTINAVDTSGGFHGIFAVNEGTGALTINSTGTATGANSTGIHARNFGTFGTALTINAVDTSGGTDGIRARNRGTGALTITSTGTASGTNYMGIQAWNEGTDLTVNAVDTSGGFHGIFAVNEGTGALSVTSTSTATGTDFNGIRARNHGTDLTVNAADTSGSYSGISAENNGVGALTITSSGMAAGAANDGIYAENSIYGTDLTVSAVETSGGENGIIAINFGIGALSISSIGTATGTANDGIYANNSANGTELAVNAADVAGGENGIFGINFGTGALTINSTGTASGTTYHGIAALNIAGGTDLTVKAVDTIGGRNGIAALNEGIGALTVISTGTATGIDSNGIGAENSGTDLTVKAVDTSGGNSGIVALNDGSGALTISSTGMATGTLLYGVYAFNSGNGSSLSITAAEVTGGVDGINVLQEGSGPAVITTSGTVAGGTGNAITAATTGAAIIVDNSGTLESGAGFALTASGGVTDLTNSGTINGRMQLSAFDDEVFNTGTFNATMDSEFGAGNDLFTNNGKVIVEGTITLAGLEQFVNNNVINMANRTVGDSLTVAGDYVGGGSLGIDVSFDGAGSSDILIVSGSARGNTSLVINDISTAPNFGNMVLVVDAGAGTVADAFSLSAESVTIGFVSYSVSFDAAGNDFFLSSAIGAPVFQTLKFVEGAQSLWQRSTHAWTAHMASPKDRSASPMWMQIDSSATGEKDSFNFTSGGFAQNINLDYEQDYFGFQLGYEFGPGVTSEGVLVGFTSGYLTSNLGFDAMADNVRYDAFNIGAYAGFKSEGFFANALAKYDIIDADVIARTAGYTADLSGEAYGVRLEAGYRWGAEAFFVQPMASIEYQQASLDDFSTLGANIDFDTFDSLHAVAGVRLGGESRVNISNALNYYLSGQAVHQSQSDDGLLFTSGISSIQIQNQLSNTFGRFEMGLSIATRGGVTGFIEGNADISGDYTGYGGRGGLKIQF